MTATDNVFYIFIEEQGEKCVIKIVQNFEWFVMIISGNEPTDLEYSYSNKFIIDDIIDDLRNKYDYVEEISFNDIDDYMS
jgi:hypothetical protein